MRAHEPNAIPLHAQLGYSSQGPTALGACLPRRKAIGEFLPRAPKALGAFLLGPTAARVSHEVQCTPSPGP